MDIVVAVDIGTGRMIITDALRKSKWIEKTETSLLNDDTLENTRDSNKRKITTW